MKRFFYSLNKGFTVLELLIVVGIIGTLAVLATQGYEGYRKRVNQASGKAQLATLFSLQKIFHNNWKTYTSTFVDLNYAPEGTVISFIYLRFFTLSTVTINNYPARQYGLCYGDGNFRGGSPNTNCELTNNSRSNQIQRYCSNSSLVNDRCIFKKSFNLNAAGDLKIRSPIGQDVFLMKATVGANPTTALNDTLITTIDHGKTIKSCSGSELGGTGSTAFSIGDADFQKQCP